MVAYRDSTTLTQASGTSAALTLPAAALAGDVLLVCLFFAGGSNVTLTAPSSDWLLVLRQNSGTTVGMAIYWARVSSSTAGPFTFAVSPSSALLAVCEAWGGADYVLPIDTSGSQANGASTSATAPSVTTAKTDAQLAAFFGGATGAVTSTPPTGYVERQDFAGAALALSCADARQGTLGASGTVVATLSASVVNIAALVALAPSALNTPGDVIDDSAWDARGWAVRFAQEQQMLQFVERQIQRANAELRSDLPAGFYPSYVLNDPWNTLLAHAELQRAQALLCTAAAQASGASEENHFGRTPDSLRLDAEHRLAQYQSIVDRARRLLVTTAATLPVTTRATYRAALRRRLRDEQAMRWPDAHLNDFLYNAILEYNRHFLLEATATIALSANVTSYSLASYTGLRYVDLVEYPAGEDPPEYLKPRYRQDPEGFWGGRYFDVTGGETPANLVIGVDPSAGETLTITYRADHQYPSSDSATWTIPPHDVDLLLLYGEWLALQAMLRGGPGEIATTQGVVALAEAAYQSRLRQRLGQ